MNASADRQILVEAILDARQQRKPSATLLSFHSDEMLATLATAIEKCDSYKAVAGHLLYSGGSGSAVHSKWLADRLADKIDQDAEQTATWLLRLLSAKAMPGIFKAAIWGLALDKGFDLGDGAKVVPFNELPASYGKSRIETYSRRPTDETVWLSHTFWNLPGAAYIRPVSDFPYIDAGHAAFGFVHRLQAEARRTWTLLEVIGSGRPLVFGSWFEYEDETFDLELHRIYLTWSHPEIAPVVHRNRPAPDPASGELAAFRQLPSDLKNLLLRSANRFVLSQCRQNHTDRILDLALAYEIATAGKGAVAPGWRVSVRSAQLIGGQLDQRKVHRAQVGEFYRRRNALTHGGGSDDDFADMKAWQETWDVIEIANGLYRRLFRSFLRLGRRPNWEDIELEAAFTEETK